MKLSILVFGLFYAHCNGLSRIAGGGSATISHYPFATSLLTNSGSGTRYLQKCGGTLVSVNAILSAASCFHSADGAPNPAGWWRARVGSSFSNSGGLVYLVRAITVHSDYNGLRIEHNLAVLRTTFNIVLEPGSVQPARIAGAAYTLSEAVPVTAIGWGEVSEGTGTSDQLRHVEIWPISQELCRNRYNALNYQVTDDMVCAGWIDVGVRGQCEGDAGSPLVDSEGIVVGVFSWAEGCAHLMYPGINTRVSRYLDWIIPAVTA